MKNTEIKNNIEMEHDLEIIKSLVLDPSESKQELLEIELEEIFRKIKSSSGLLDIEKYFTLLDQIQFKLARLVFKEDVIVSKRLRRFITDFDRLDDKPTRDWLYESIVSNAYSF